MLINSRTISFLLILLISIFSACSGGSKKETEKKSPKTETPEETKKTSFGEFLPAVFNIVTYDGERRLESGAGFFVTENLAVTPYSIFGNANRAVLAPLDGSPKLEAEGFLAVDRINDLVLIKVKDASVNPPKIYTGPVPVGALTYLVSAMRGNIVPINKGKMLEESTLRGSRVYRISNVFQRGNDGRPVFLKNREVLGLSITRMDGVDQEYLAIPGTQILELLKKKDEPLKELALLGGKADPKVSAANARIKGVVIETDLGNITIKLYNDMPQYRDNFLKLVREQYYDSLLWHRVIEDFVVQSGAADTRHAASDDIVGWKGPGYTLPANIHPRYFHRRGIIGVPRLPDRQNRYKRSDGSQFYIVTGRLYHDAELDAIEKEKNFKFTQQQRKVYKTIGGAPTLDNEYTIFGEVISGMEVADKLNQLEVNNDWRPVKDVRVKRMKIIQ